MAAKLSSSMHRPRELHDALLSNKARKWLSPEAVTCVQDAMRAYNPPKYRCLAPCHYGGLSAARKHSRAELGYMWRCNRPVKNEGDRCYQHAEQTN